MKVGFFQQRKYRRLINQAAVKMRAAEIVDGSVPVGSEKPVRRISPKHIREGITHLYQRLNVFLVSQLQDEVPVRRVTAMTDNAFRRRIDALTDAIDAIEVPA